MTPQPPLLLVDNVFDTVMLYPNASLTTTSELAGHEGFRVADARRERTSWRASTTGTFQSVFSDLGVGATHAVDMLWIDRGHNLWGKTVQVTGDNGSGGGSNGFATAVPALGTLGGDPAAGFAVTEEGALYTTHPGLQFGAKRRWIVSVQESWAPLISGIMLGQRTQLLGYSRTFDEDAGERTQSKATSTAGYQGSDATYSWRTLDLDLAMIGATEYDGTIRTLRRLLFERNQPAFALMDYGTRPERGWLYQMDGTTWGFAKSRVLRSGRIRLREVGASLP